MPSSPPLMRSRVVGLYGVSGSGKSHALAKLQDSRPEWRCVEGSTVLKSVLAKREMAFETFQMLGAQEGTESKRLAEEIRNDAICSLRALCGITVVAGHASFANAAVSTEGETVVDGFRSVFTEGDAKTYDFIFLLDTDASIVEQQRVCDTATGERSRLPMATGVLQEWSQYEKQVLIRECNANSIPLEVIGDGDIVRLERLIVSKVVLPVIREAQLQSEQELRKTVLETIPPADVYLLIDGDRSLCPEDTGKLFFEITPSPPALPTFKDPLKSIHTRYPDYCFQGFIEVAMLYEKVVPVEYERRCKEIAHNAMNLYPAWLSFLSDLPSDVHPILVSSGIRNVWQEVLEKHGLVGTTIGGGEPKMSIIAGNHISQHSYIVDGGAKGIVVSTLREKLGGCNIVSFGDSAVDLCMLQMSDRSYVVLDDRRNRSLRGFIQQVTASNDSQNVYQLLPGDELPVASLHCGLKLGHLAELKEELTSGSIHRVLSFDNKSSAAALATQSRRADLSGPSLQAVHYEIGKHLADRLVDAFPWHLMMINEFSHVQQGATFAGKVTTNELLILPLMRGGEPIARGVFERFPNAKMFHMWDDKKYEADEVVKEELASFFKSVQNVVVVDSVINEGRSIRNTLGYLRGLSRHTSALRFYVLTAVMQKSASLDLPREFPTVRFLTLRVSDNKYTGKGGTDTGNRLFGTI